jgi:hypothetical protein
VGTLRFAHPTFSLIEQHLDERMLPLGGFFLESKKKRHESRLE